MRQKLNQGPETSVLMPPKFTCTKQIKFTRFHDLVTMKKLEGILKHPKHLEALVYIHTLYFINTLELCAQWSKHFQSERDTFLFQGASILNLNAEGTTEIHRKRYKTLNIISTLKLSGEKKRKKKSTILNCIMLLWITVTWNTTLLERPFAFTLKLLIFAQCVPCSPHIYSLQPNDSLSLATSKDFRCHFILQNHLLF